ncbi:LOW QUALITY PROTEIN: cystatin-A1-like [Micropterus salmoides]|uniref:LOW QUALITY PROTEIN: cystatin-A1-like n=1 Tax=Micropterus salmoides TaxID=27706 RepID=UPI0018ED688D|nr:LOW QUALITY PROTEIN: cystatin-A1-like [Micropterus salmoides]
MVKDDMENRTGKTYVEFKAVKYRSQVVAGENYLTKVHMGGSSYLHLKVFQYLSCNGGKISKCDVQEDHRKEDPLVSF